MGEMIQEPPRQTNSSPDEESGLIAEGMDDNLGAGCEGGLEEGRAMRWFEEVLVRWWNEVGEFRLPSSMSSIGMVVSWCGVGEVLSLECWIGGRLF